VVTDSCRHDPNDARSTRRHARRWSNPLFDTEPDTVISTLLRWLPRLARTSRPSRRPRTARLELQPLEARDCPASFTWIGTSDGSPGDWSDANNWFSANASGVPTATDDVVFRHIVSPEPPGQPRFDADCINSSVSGQLAHSITILSDWPRTLHLEQGAPVSVGGPINGGIDTGGIELDGGEITQETGQAIECLGDFTWAGGLLNVNTAVLADLNLSGGGSFNLRAGNEQTGSNINLKNRSTGVINIPGNTITFLKNANVFIDAGSTLNLVDGTLATTGTGRIGNGGNLYKSPGTQDFTSGLPIRNSGGTFQLQAGTLKITGQDGNGWSFDQLSGTTDLWNDSTLRLTAPFHQEDGNFWTEGASGANIIATIIGNATFDGGLINLNHGQQGGTTGFLFVTNVLKIQGSAEWDCKVDCTSLKADAITATTVTLGGDSVFKALAVNVPATGVPAGKAWAYLRGINPITTDFGVSILDFNDGSGGEWTDTTPDGGKNWNLQS
jgi:hypothetical protein